MSRLHRLSGKQSRKRRILFERLENRHLLATLTVTSNVDSGAGSLRQAILDANSLAGPDVIEFNVGGGGAQSIVLSSVLPEITDAVSIDGSSQPGFAGTPLVSVDATGVAGTILTASADNTMLNDFSISNAEDTALLLDGTDNATVDGLDLSFTGRKGVGLVVQGASDTVTIQNLAVMDRSNAILIRSARNVEVFDNRLSGSLHALDLAVAGDLRVSGNDFTGVNNGLVVRDRVGDTIGDAVPVGASSYIVLEASSGLTTAIGTAVSLVNMDAVTVEDVDLSYSGTGAGNRIEDQRRLRRSDDQPDLRCPSHVWSIDQFYE